MTLEAVDQPKRGLSAAAMGFQLRVAPDLVPLVKPMADFKPHPRNLRVHNLDAIIASIDAYGQQTPMTVQRSTGFICKGNGTYKALQMLGATEAAFSVEEFDDDTAWRYLLADNKTSDLASYDKRLTLEALEQLAEGSKGLDATLWSADDLDDLRAEVGQILINEPDYVNADYAVDADMLARRTEAAGRPGIKMKTTSVLLTVEAHEKFLADVQLLRKHFETSGVIATIVEAVKRMAELVRAGEAPAERNPVDEAVTEEDLVARI